MADQLFLFEITVRPCTFIKDVLQGTCRNLKEGAAKAGGKIIHGFKVIGENKIIAVLNGGIESSSAMVNQAYGEYLDIVSTPIRSYELLAQRVLAVDSTLTAPSTHKLGNDGQLFWLYFSIDYKGFEAHEFLKIWMKDATGILSLRTKGDLELDLFKVVGQREVHLFIKVPDADMLDDIVFTLPLLKELGNQVTIRTKAIDHMTNVAL